MIDINYLREMQENGLDLNANLKLLAADTPTRLLMISTSVVNKDFETLHKTLHRLHGDLLTIGATGALAAIAHFRSQVIDQNRIIDTHSELAMKALQNAINEAHSQIDAYLSGLHCAPDALE
jgi:HPt (histidine-containing phosphotransfer) domain-containing protein